MIFQVHLELHRKEKFCNKFFENIFIIIVYQIAIYRKLSKQFMFLKEFSRYYQYEETYFYIYFLIHQIFELDKNKDKNL